MKIDHLIIGGGIAGVSAAEEIRARDASCSILVLGDEPYQTYSRVMLPHVVRGKTPEARVFLRTADGLAAKRIGYESGTTVDALDAERHFVWTSDGRQIEYGKALIATGGRARSLECPGADRSVLRFQTLDDARRIVAASEAKRAVVVGGGFIALELLMSFRAFGAEAVSVTRKGSFFSMLGPEAQEIIERQLTEAGVLRRKGVTVTEIAKNDAGATVVKLSSGADEPADVIGTGLGLERDLRFVPDDGQVKIVHGVVTDEHLRSSSPDVFAAGDAAEYFDVRVGRHRVPGNWQAAMFQGKVAGANMAGDHVRFDALTTYTISCFGLPLAFLGATEAPDERIVRQSGDAIVEWYVEKGKVVGAAVVGANAERAAIQKIVAAGVEAGGMMRRQLEAGALDGLV